MKKRPTLYRYTLLIFILLSVVMFAANVFFYQYNVKQIQKHRSEQVETAADYLKNWVEMHFVQMHLYTRELFQCPDLRFMQNPELFPAWEFYDGVKNLQSRMNFPATSDELDKNTYLIIKNKNILLTGSEMMPLYESGIYEGISELGTIRRLRLYPVDGKLYLIDFPQIYQQTIAVDDASVLLCVEIDQNVLIQYAKLFLGEDLVSLELLLPDGGAVLRYADQVNGDVPTLKILKDLQGTSHRLKLVLASPEYDRSLNMASHIILSCFLIMLVAVCLFAKQAERTIHRPIQNMVRAFENVSVGDYDVQLSGEKTKEFQYLNHAITDTVNRLKKSIETEYEQRLELQQAEFAQYQLQINPHFLYNGFYNIQRMCSNGQQDKAALLSKRLASYYRYVTRKGISFVPLAEEIRHMGSYIEIQSIRFQDRIKVALNYHFDSDTNLQVPTLIFQPMVENVYEHAFDTQETNGRIEVNMYFEDHVFYCTVEDSGEGMPDSLVEKMNRQMRGEETTPEYSGILNVNKRLRLYYGEDSGLYYEKSQALHGVKIVMRIDPSGRKEEDDVSDAFGR